MGLLDEFFMKKSIKLRQKSLGFMTSVFHSTLGKKRKDDGEIGFDKIVIYSLTLAVGIGVLFRILDILETSLPYIIISALVVIVFRKQLQEYVSQKIKTKGVLRTNISPKYHQDSAKEKGNKENSVVGHKPTRDEAVKQLKEAKEMLDAGILTKNEYDSLSKKLKPIIIDN